MGLTSCACSRSGPACYSASHPWNPSDSGDPIRHPNLSIKHSFALLHLKKVSKFCYLWNPLWIRGL